MTKTQQWGAHFFFLNVSIVLDNIILQFESDAQYLPVIAISWLFSLVPFSTYRYKKRQDLSKKTKTKKHTHKKTHKQQQQNNKIIGGKHTQKQHNTTRKKKTKANGNIETTITAKQPTSATKNTETSFLKRRLYCIHVRDKRWCGRGGDCLASAHFIKLEL